MTHDELLWVINSVVEAGPCETVGHWSSAKALLAIVELHKPYDNSYDIDGSDLRCSECGQGFEYYPCPTIQAIEKELG